ncbi:TM0106 family RecB-like putative nuclease [Corynebacterium ulceribovis]|uniref:TM0106 family RecB-like putative nuclease n=1 Tax=Corynebacterium ulceribovis TaxID=487732 RepID=UPI00037A668A|nr:TM0106 family RecB-like putative nuclease [Corynebacterium ulceribovis]
MIAKDFRLSAKDLVGCRYRTVLDYLGEDLDLRSEVGGRRHQHRAEHTQKVVRNISALQPVTQVLIDDNQDEVDHFLATLEAIASGAPLIAGGLLLGSGQQSQPELLVRTDGGTGSSPGVTYAPVFIVAHKIFDRRTVAAESGPLAVDTLRLGLSTPVPHPKLRTKPRHFDSVIAGQAHALLSELGCAADMVGLIGFDDSKAVFESATAVRDVYATALRRTRHALAAARGELAPVPMGTYPVAPRKVRECRTCRHWQRCEAELAAADDISLLVPGDRGAEFRARGISTLTALADDPAAGEMAALARAWKLQLPALRKRDAVTAPRADVEIDIDMEAYLEHGCYLWGTFDGQQYRPFVTWGELGGREEAENFAAFWQWLSARRADAAAAGQTCLVYCYAAQGENHWLRTSARRFAQWSDELPGLPTLAEIEEFIASDQWVDMFRVVKKQLVGPYGLSLKTVAPIAGFQWRDAEPDGEASLEWYRRGLRTRLLEYNEDDCRSTAVLRQWLDGGGAQLLPTVAQCSPSVPKPAQR